MLQANRTLFLQYMRDDGGCAGEEEERKTEAEADGQHQVRLDRDALIGQRRVRSICLEAIIANIEPK